MLSFVILIGLAILKWIVMFWLSVFLSLFSEPLLLNIAVALGIEPSAIRVSNEMKMYIVTLMMFFGNLILFFYQFLKKKIGLRYFLAVVFWTMLISLFINMILFQTIQLRWEDDPSRFIAHIFVWNVWNIILSFIYLINNKKR